MPTSGCLVTSTPELDSSGDRTPPFLVPWSATPDQREVKVISDDTPVKFSALVISEDQDMPLSVAMYVDYGDPQKNYAVGQPAPPWPYYKWFPGQAIEASTLDDRSRYATATYYPQVDPIKPGCHTFTMIVSHAFENDAETGRHCPTTLEDSSELTWIVLRCEPGDPCDVLDIKKGDQTDAKRCPVPREKCPATSTASSESASQTAEERP